jgi:hypothetical protein
MHAGPDSDPGQRASGLASGTSHTVQDAKIRTLMFSDEDEVVFSGLPPAEAALSDEKATARATGERNRTLSLSVLQRKTHEYAHVVIKKDDAQQS